MTVKQRAITELKGVGPKVADKLARLGLRNIGDILFHLPLRYEDRTQIIPIARLQAGQSAAIEGRVIGTRVVFAGRRSLTVYLADDSGIVSLRFFHFSAAQQQGFVEGIQLRCFGSARFGRQGLEIVHPEYRISNASQPAVMSSYLTPVYPATDGISQSLLRSITRQALDYLQQGAVAELLPAEFNHAGVPLTEALRYLHQPPADADLAALQQGLHPYQQSLAFEELLAHHLSLLKVRERCQRYPAPVLEGSTTLQQQFLQALPFSLTAAQQRVLDEINRDLRQACPMLRLVQGDVGAGKTVVAALSALTAVSSQHQVAIMAPTEILAEQHLNAFHNWFEPLGIRIAWLTGRIKGQQRQKVLASIADGSAQIVIGTHALFQEDVNYAGLGLTIIDEQHRFGVAQRLSLRDKGLQQGYAPHQLTMTATPIPRTLAMSAYADLDFSIIDQLPPGRTPINTVAIAASRREQVISRVRQACRDRQQAYWVCTLIEESELLQCEAAEATAARLAAELGELRVGLVHGRMKADQKDQVMRDFSAGLVDLLVATTVIEVGVDVPNASLMIIENPERLGLSQLHQLRGRVGRGTIASHCVLLYATPLSNSSKQRIDILRKTNDGFVIAEKDLELRGPGEVLGTRQTGELQLKIADLDKNSALLPEVKRCARQLLANYPERVQPLIRRWLAENEIYAQV